MYRTENAEADRGGGRTVGRGQGARWLTGKKTMMKAGLVHENQRLAHRDRSRIRTTIRQLRMMGFVRRVKDIAIATEGLASKAVR